METVTSSRPVLLLRTLSFVSVDSVKEWIWVFLFPPKARPGWTRDLCCLQAAIIFCPALPPPCWSLRNCVSAHYCRHWQADGVQNGIKSTVPPALVSLAVLQGVWCEVNCLTRCVWGWQSGSNAEWLGLASIRPWVQAPILPKKNKVSFKIHLE
jgi:hypothetical protein